MLQRKSSFQLLEGGYLFPEIEKRKVALLAKEPEAKIISLGIGDTTLPLAPHISSALAKAGTEMGTAEGYHGYGPAKGDPLLRKKIAETVYAGKINPDDIFVTDGSKCDIARLQMLLADSEAIAIQDPAYPVYADTTIMTGKKLHLIPCTPANNFFPKAEQLPNASVLILCSPNNPTGAAATHEQLQELVDWALKNGALLIFDAAYAAFIQDKNLPRSIFEIEGAEKVAIELNSFSKSAGFTGIRLGWTVVPETVVYKDGIPIKKDWERLLNTCFNGASRLSQAGAFAALDSNNSVKENILAYLKNAERIRECLHGLGIETYGGKHIPYIWANFPGKSSWEIFDLILRKCHVVTTPGAGFGKAGEGFIRFSGFALPEHVEHACKRLAGVF